MTRGQKSKCRQISERYGRKKPRTSSGIGIMRIAVYLNKKAGTKSDGLEKRPS